MTDFLVSIYPDFLEEAEYLLNNLPFAIWETI